MKKIIKELYPYVIIVVVVILVRTFIITPVIVSGSSMKPNFNDGELLLVRKIKYNEKTIKRFDVVVIKKDKEEIIKRVIGLPGEHISYKNNKLYVNEVNCIPFCLAHNLWEARNISYKELLNIMMKDAIENEVQTQKMTLVMDNDIIKKMTNRTIKEMK